MEAAAWMGTVEEFGWRAAAQTLVVARCCDESPTSQRLLGSWVEGSLEGRWRGGGGGGAIEVGQV